MMVGLRENEFMGCGEYTGMVIWEIENHLFVNFKDTISIVR